jgi:hypothetical protein
MAGARPGFSEAKTFAEIVQAKRIRERSAIATGFRSVVALDHLVAHPAGDEESEDAVLVCEADKNREDYQVHNTLGVLAVVHGADAGDEAQQRG